MSAWTSTETAERIQGYLGVLFEALGLSSPQESATRLLADREQFNDATQQLQKQINVLDQQLLAQSQASQSARQQRATLRILGECSLRLVALAYQWPKERLEASPSFLAHCAQRPVAKLDYDQLYCSPDSTERRSQRVLAELPPQGRVLLLGDDDLTSLALASQHHGPIDVIEYDKRLLEHIQENAPHLDCYAIDLFLGGLPHELVGAFDAVVLDPPWDDYHAWCFLHKAHLALKSAPHARIHMAFCPLQVAWLERKAQRFWRRFAQVGLAIEAVEMTWHLYPLQGTEFMKLLLSHSPQLDSLLLQAFQQLPFGFSDLYTLRAIEGFRMKPWVRWFQRWWHIDSKDIKPFLPEHSVA
ncbi:MAG: bis-aminopropyl spermidine synthase family protein [Myxococcales bacterium]|nr:bis-aminopropyl spermidine synthase family protein [Myxococcales bacterium]